MLFSEIVTRLLKYTNTFLNPFLYRLKFWAENKKKWSDNIKQIVNLGNVGL